MEKIAPAFIKAKKEFGPALKDKTNPAFRSKYADLGACLDAVDDALLNNGIALYQETFEDATGITVETVLLHESGETLRSGRLHVPASKQDPQGYGSALTYARRYSLMTACGIAPEDDDGNAATEAKRKAEEAAKAKAEKEAKEKADLEYAKYKEEHLPSLRAASFNGMDALTAEFKKLPKSDFKAALWTEHGGSLKEGAELAQRKVAA
jgi:hypothetical protein